MLRFLEKLNSHIYFPFFFCQKEAGGHKISHLCTISHQPLLLKEGAFQMLIKVLERCIAVADSDEKQFCENRNIDKCGFPLLTWCNPVFKSFSLINDSRKAVQALGIYDR